MAYQALTYRREWNTFLELITPNEVRKEFLKQYDEKLRDKLKDGMNDDQLKGLSKELLPSEQGSFEKNMDIYKELVKQGNDLINFLDSPAIAILKNIEEMEKYRRAFNVTTQETSYRRLRELYNEGKNYVELGKYPEAIKNFEIYLDRDPNNIRVMNKKAYSLAYINKFQEATTIIDKVLEISPEYARALDTKGFILLKEGRIGEAKAWIEKAYDKNPTFIGTCEHLAEVYEKLGDKENARKYRDRADELRRNRT